MKKLKLPKVVQENGSGIVFYYADVRRMDESSNAAGILWFVAKRRRTYRAVTNHRLLYDVSHLISRRELQRLKLTAFPRLGDRAQAPRGRACVEAQPN